LEVPERGLAIQCLQEKDPLVSGKSITFDKVTHTHKGTEAMRAKTYQPNELGSGGQRCEVTHITLLLLSHHSTFIGSNQSIIFTPSEHYLDSEP
jgi:hypothetical protein